MSVATPTGPVLAGAAAIDEFNLAVGEVALSLDPDDPRQLALLSVQAGLDELYTAEFERTADRRLVDTALNRIGHQGSPKFRTRLAAAFTAARGELVAR